MLRFMISSYFPNVFAKYEYAVNQQAKASFACDDETARRHHCDLQRS